jgi:hypothetical protein
MALGLFYGDPDSELLEAFISSVRFKGAQRPHTV